MAPDVTIRNLSAGIYSELPQLSGHVVLQVKDVEEWLGQRGIKAFYDFGVETDRQGNVWIYKDDNVWTLSPKDNSTTQFSLPPKDGQITGAKDSQKGMILLTRRALYIKPSGQKARRLASLPEEIPY